MAFQKATKKRAKLRLAIIGQSGSGKTYTALTLATHLVPGGRVALIDTEHGSASKYADLFNFDVLELDSFSPRTYIEAIKEAVAAGYDVLIIDSLTHAWSGKDGALEQVDRIAKRDKSGNSFAAWRDVTPLHNLMVEAIIRAPLHVIATIRSKMEYVQEKDDRGKTVIRKVGLQPVQRDGLEYEFDVVADMDQDNIFYVTKSRCVDLHNAIIEKPGRELAETLAAWLDNGAEPESRKVEQPPATAPATAGSNGGNGTAQQASTPRGVSPVIAREAAPSEESVIHEHADAIMESEFDALISAAQERGATVTQIDKPASTDDKKEDPKVVFSSSRYANEVRTFVNQVPYYQDAKGNVDGYHIKGALQKLGIYQVTNENIDQVWAALRKYAGERTGTPEPTAQPEPEAQADLFEGATA